MTAVSASGARYQRALWLTVAALLLAAGLRFHDLGAQSLWTDEAGSVFFSRQPVAEMIRIVLVDGIHPPLYYFFQQAFFVLGYSEFAVRLPAAFFGILTVAAIGRLGQVWRLPSGGASRGLLGLLAAVSPFAVWYSRDARMYPMLALLTVGVMWSFAMILRRRSTASAGLYATFAGLSAALYMTHYFGLFAPLVQFAFLLATFRANHRLVRPWALAQFVAAIPVAAWLFVLYSRGAYFGVGWIHPSRLFDLILTLQNFAVGYGDEAWRWAVTALYALAAGYGFWQLRQSRRTLLLVLWLAFPPVVTLILSLRRPAYVDRFLIVSQPALVLSTGLGLAALRQSSRALGLAATAITVSATAWAGWLVLDPLQYPKEDWRQAAAAITREATPEDILVLQSPNYLIPFRHYYAGPQEYEFLSNPASLARLQGKADSRLWLILRGRLEDAHRFAESIPPNLDTDVNDPAVRAWLASIEPHQTVRYDYSGVAVLRYDLAGDAP